MPFYIPYFPFLYIIRSLRVRERETYTTKASIKRALVPVAPLFPLLLYAYDETIASYGTRFVVCDIRAWSFAGVNSLRSPS